MLRRSEEVGDAISRQWVRLNLEGWPECGADRGICLVLV